VYAQRHDVGRFGCLTVGIQQVNIARWSPTCAVTTSDVRDCRRAGTAITGERLRWHYTEWASLRLKITTAVVRNARPPASGYLLLWEVFLVGFALRVTVGGVRSFVVEKRIGGRSRRVTLGSWPAVRSLRAGSARVLIELC
jgi:hypothetical protein